MQTLALVRSHVHRCDPQIELHMPAMDQLIQSQPLVATCHYDGIKMHITHSKPGVHNAFQILLNTNAQGHNIPNPALAVGSLSLQMNSELAQVEGSPRIVFRQVAFE